jgi:hypothetical protein
MKAKQRIILLAVVLVSLAAVLGSCSRKACPAYSSTQMSQTQNNG